MGASWVGAMRTTTYLILATHIYVADAYTVERITTNRHCAVPLPEGAYYCPCCGVYVRDAVHKYTPRPGWEDYTPNTTDEDTPFGEGGPPFMHQHTTHNTIGPFCIDTDSPGQWVFGLVLEQAWPGKTAVLTGPMPPGLPIDVTIKADTAALEAEVARLGIGGRGWSVYLLIEED